MSGISSYFHGEEGEAVDFEWVADDDRLTYLMTLSSDPHRKIAQAYGSDIGIDPAIQRGSRAVYLRVSPWVGVWVNKSDCFNPQLKKAVERTVGENRAIIREYGSLAKSARSGWLNELAVRTGTPARRRREGERYPEQPATDITVFLSYSSRNVLMARQFYESLREDARADVWFDLARPGEAPAHDASIEDWLRGAVRGSHAFLLLLTRASVASKWVLKEIDIAAARAQEHEHFHLILLNLEGVEVPGAAARAKCVIDCGGLSIGEIAEELYAAVYRRQGRRAWLAEQWRRGWQEEVGRPLSYDHLMSDGGRAVALQWEKKGWDIHWQLSYSLDDSDAIPNRVKGVGREKVVDFNIRAGDRVGFFMYNHNVPLWMRSDDLTVTAGDVFSAYYRKLDSPPLQARLASGLVAVCGLLLVAVEGVVVTNTLFRNFFTGQPEGLDPALLESLRSIVKVIFGITTAIYGINQVINVAHPIQWRNRVGADRLWYLGHAFELVAWGTACHAIVHGLIVFIGYMVVGAVVFGIIGMFGGGDWMPTLLYGYVGAYGASALYSMYRVVKLAREGPEYVSDPEFTWLP